MIKNSLGKIGGVIGQVIPIVNITPVAINTGSNTMVVAASISLPPGTWILLGGTVSYTSTNDLVFSIRAALTYGATGGSVPTYFANSDAVNLMNSSNLSSVYWRGNTDGMPTIPVAAYPGALVSSLTNPLTAYLLGGVRATGGGSTAACFGNFSVLKVQ